MPSSLDIALVLLGIGLTMLLVAIIGGNSLTLLAGVALTVQSVHAIWRTSPRR